MKRKFLFLSHKEVIPCCFAANCKKKAVYKAGLIHGNYFGYCEKHSFILGYFSFDAEIGSRFGSGGRRVLLNE